MKRIDTDVVVVGAGFAGLYAIHRFRALGFRVQCLEAADDVGGTWYWNRYPGARCDIPTSEYSYSFSKELARDWRWTERYASQPEILAYLRHVADRFELRRDIRFGERVTAVHFDDADATWRVRTAAGTEVAARWCVMATGCLSEPKLPDIPGLDDFAGRMLVTGRWPREGVDFTGRHVGVFGVGSSGIQAIPELARQAARVTVFQRTPSFSVPARNRPLAEGEHERTLAGFDAMRERMRRSYTSFADHDPPPTSALAATPAERERAYQEAWAEGGIRYMFSYGDLMTNREANETAAQFLRDRIAGIVTDARVAATLQPRSYPIGTRRLCLDTDYYATYNRPNVTLVDVGSNPVRRITRDGVELADGTLHRIDDLVLATGFDAVTGALLAMDVRGAGGLPLADKWRDGPGAYLGLMIAGFPNLFTITGPGSPSVLSNMVVSIEQHVDVIAGMLDAARARGATRIEADAQAEADWVRHVGELAHTTLYPEARSWYMGSNVPGKARVFLPYVGGVGPYRKLCEDVAAAGWRGFYMR